MNPRWVAASVVVIAAVVAALFWSRSRGTPSEPVMQRRPEPETRVVRVYPLARPDPEPVVSPPGEDGPNPRTALDPAEMPEFAEAANEAMGTAWHDCIAPWQEQANEEGPLALNLVIEDGRVVDTELVTPLPVDEQLVNCVSDAVWSVTYPELPDHRGRVQLQRVGELRR